MIAATSKRNSRARDSPVNIQGACAVTFVGLRTRPFLSVTSIGAMLTFVIAELLSGCENSASPSVPDLPTASSKPGQKGFPQQPLPVLSKIR